MTHEVTLSEEQIVELVEKICAGGPPWGPSGEEYCFQNRFNRDAIAMRCQQNGAKIKRSSIANQLIDPRYTVEGSHLPDKGLANDSIFTNLYCLVRTL